MNTEQKPIACNIHLLRGDELGYEASNRFPLPPDVSDRQGRGRKFVAATGDSEDEAMNELADKLGVSRDRLSVAWRSQ